MKWFFCCLIFQNLFSLSTKVYFCIDATLSEDGIRLAKLGNKKNHFFSILRELEYCRFSIGQNFLSIPVRFPLAIPLNDSLIHPFPISGNYFFHSLPVPKFWQSFFSFHSHSRIKGMGLFRFLPVLELSRSCTHKSQMWKAWGSDKFLKQLAKLKPERLLLQQMIKQSHREKKVALGTPGFASGRCATDLFFNPARFESSSPNIDVFNRCQDLFCENFLCCGKTIGVWTNWDVLNSFWTTCYIF